MTSTAFVEFETVLETPASYPLARTAGFFLAARSALTYLFFQSDPRLGSMAFMALTGILFIVSVLARANDGSRLEPSRLLWPIARGAAAYLLLCGASLLWTQADSKIISAAYFAVMVLDCLTILSLVRGHEANSVPQEISLGFVYGCLFLAALAWYMPALPDHRIGHEEFLHPNGLGLNFALAAILAQHLPRRIPYRGVMFAALVISLLRTISKTSIIAFLVTEVALVIFSKRWPRRTKIRFVLVSALILTAFSHLFINYASGYASNGDEAETLTGRTTIWAVSYEMALETPWLGKGLYSFRAQIPAFSSFQPWHAHDEFLQQFFEFGICGVLITAWLYWEMFWWGKKAKDESIRHTALLLVLFCLLHGLTDTVNFGLSMPLWLTTLLGLRFAAAGTREGLPC